MISKFIAWLVELFRKKPKNQVRLEENIKTLEKRIKEIDGEKISDSDINDHFNK